MSDPIYTGTVGIPIRLTLLDQGQVHDPADASVREIILTRPDGTAHTKEAAVGEDSSGRPCLEYVTGPGDLDMPGGYTAAGYLEDGAGKWPAAPVEFRVSRHPRPLRES